MWRSPIVRTILFHFFDTLLRPTASFVRDVRKLGHLLRDLIFERPTTDRCVKVHTGVPVGPDLIHGVRSGLVVTFGAVLDLQQSAAID